MREIGKAGFRPRPPSTPKEAMESLCQPSDLKVPLIRDRIDTVSFDGLPEPLVDFMRALKAEMARYGIPMSFMETWRDGGRQEQLKASGVSRAGSGQSPHQFGLAFDYVHAVRGWKLHPLEWAQIGAIGHEVARKRKVPIEWGGDWKFYDPAHWQIKGWKSWRSVMASYDPPLDASNRPTVAQWSAVIGKVQPALLRR